MNVQTLLFVSALGGVVFPALANDWDPCVEYADDPQLFESYGCTLAPSMLPSQAPSSEEFGATFDRGNSTSSSSGSGSGGGGGAAAAGAVVGVLVVVAVGVAGYIIYMKRQGKDVCLWACCGGKGGPGVLPEKNPKPEPEIAVVDNPEGGKTVAPGSANIDDEPSTATVGITTTPSSPPTNATAGSHNFSTTYEMPAGVLPQSDAHASSKTKDSGYSAEDAYAYMKRLQEDSSSRMSEVDEEAQAYPKEHALDS